MRVFVFGPQRRRIIRAARSGNVRTAMSSGVIVPRGVIVVAENVKSWHLHGECQPAKPRECSAGV